MVRPRVRRLVIGNRNRLLTTAGSRKKAISYGPETMLLALEDPTKRHISVGGRIANTERDFETIWRAQAPDDPGRARHGDGVRGGGAYSCKHDGSVNDVKQIYEPLRREDTGQKIWDHTMTAFNDIEEGRVFKG